jgi:uncharacterized membrane protein YfhO
MSKKQLIDINRFKPKNPLPAIREFFLTKPHIWLSFCIPFAIMFVAYMYFGIWPNGERSVLSLDLNAQYVYYFIYMRDALFGTEDLLYSWGRNLSGEFVGIIGYYLFSPFNILVWIFPVSMVTEGLALMMMTKIGAIGAAMAIYLTYSRKFSKHTVVMFSIMYALLSYNIVQTMNPMWLDGVFILPLVVMGIENLLKNGTYKLLIFSLVYAFLTCFYIGYMIAIFTVLYYIYYALTSRKYNAGNMVVLLKRSGLFAISAALAAMLSAFILLPVYSALSMGKLEFSNPNFSIKANFDLVMISRKLFMNSYDTVRMPEGMPFLYSGTLALLLLPVYFSCDRIRRTRRTGGIILMFTLILSMMIVPIDMMWHGGQNPNWLPYRYSFMFCFLMIAFSAEAFEHIRKVSLKAVGMSAAFFMGLLIYWQAADSTEEKLGRFSFQADTERFRELFDWVTVVLPAMGVLLLFTGIIIIGRDRLNKHNMLTSILVAVIALELLYSTYGNLDKQHSDIHFSSRDSFQSMIVTRQVMDGIIANDDGFWRSEKQFIRSACDPMATRMKGVTHSSSMLNDRAIDILKSMGYAARSHASRYWGNTPLTDDLFGFKYTLSLVDGSRSHDGAKNIDNIVVNENHDVLPIAYLVRPKMWDYSFSGLNNDDVFENQNKMLSYMIEPNVKKVEPQFVDPRNLTHLNSGYLVYTKMREYDEEGQAVPAHLEFDFAVDTDGHVYAHFPSDVTGNYTVFLRDNESGGEYYNEDGELVQGEIVYNDVGRVVGVDNLHYIGYFENEDEFTVRVTFTENRLIFQDEIFLRLNSGMENLLVIPEEGSDMEGIDHSAVAGFAVADEREDYFTEIFFVQDGKRSLNVRTMAEDGVVFNRINQAREAYIRHEFVAYDGGEYFAYFPGDYERMYELLVNGVRINQNDANHIHFMGYFEQGTEFELTVSVVGNESEFMFQEALFAVVAPDNLLSYTDEDGSRSDAAERYYKRILSYLQTLEADGDRYLIRLETPEPSLFAVTATEQGGHTVYTAEGQGGNRTIEFSLRADADGDFFAYFPTSQHPYYYVTVNGERPPIVFPNELSAHYLGNFSAGENITVTINLTGESTHIREAIFARAKFDFAGQGTLRNKDRALTVLQNSDVFQYFKRITPYERLPSGLTRDNSFGNGYIGYRREAGWTGNSHIEYFFRAEADGDFYFYFPSGYERKCNLWIAMSNDDGSWPQQGRFVGQVYETDHHHVHHLGYIERGQYFRVTLSLADANVQDVFFRDEGFFRLDRDLLEADVAKVHEINEKSTFVARNNRHLRVTTNHSEEMMLFTTIPNEPGWRITVNGKRAEIREVGQSFTRGEGGRSEEEGIGLIAIVVPPGENRIDLKFFPNLMPYGIILFFAGIGGLVALSIFLNRYTARETAIRERQAASKSRSKKRKSVRVVNLVRDEYDGYDSDYVDIDPIDDDYFEEVAETEAKDDIKNDSDD